jgi:Uma2 family endonuclease
MRAETLAMATIPNRSMPGSEPQPTWEIALLYPNQGEWTESDYLALDTNRLVELVDGNLEFLPMPTTSHQFIVQYLYGLLLGFVDARKLGKVIFAPLRIRIRPKTMREPDIIYISRKHYRRIGEEYWTGADLVVEVVSPDKRSQKRDYQEKRVQYAQRGIAEYWIVDPQKERISVLALKGKSYRVHGEFAPGQRATSVLLSGFAVDVSAVFAAGKNRG